MVKILRNIKLALIVKCQGPMSRISNRLSWSPPHTCSYQVRVLVFLLTADVTVL